MSHNKHFIYCYLKLIVDNIVIKKPCHVSFDICSRRGHLSYNMNLFLGPGFKFDISKIVGNFLGSKINLQKKSNKNEFNNKLFSYLSIAFFSFTSFFVYPACLIACSFKVFFFFNLSVSFALSIHILL